MKNNSNIIVIALLLIVVIILGYLAFFKKDTVLEQTINPSPIVAPEEKEIPDVLPKSATKQKPYVTTLSPTNLFIPVPCVVPPSGGGCITSPGVPSLTLNGTFDGHELATTTWFEYWYDVNPGTVGNYNNNFETAHVLQKVLKGNVSEQIVGFPMGHTYHIRIVAQNSVGISYGNIQTFSVPIP